MPGRTPATALRSGPCAAPSGVVDRSRLAAVGVQTKFRARPPFGGGLDEQDRGAAILSGVAASFVLGAAILSGVAASFVLGAAVLSGVAASFVLSAAIGGPPARGVRTFA